jgi:carboxyl-terminal processing protease
VRVHAIPLPAYAYSYRLLDPVPGGNGDGLVQVGETVTLRLSVTNQGQGPALETLAMIEDKAGSDLFLRKGRITLGESLGVGQTKDFDFTFQVRGRAETDGRPLELMVRDTVLREYLVERLSFRIREPTQVAVKPRKGWLATVADAPLLAGAAEDAREVARALKGTTFELVGEIGRFYKVALGTGGETAFLAAAQARPAPEPRGGKASPELVLSQKRRPPEIVIEGANEPLIVRGERYLIKGWARDDTELKDVYIFAGRRKVFFSALDPSKGGPPELPFEASVPLEQGDNVITVIAREGEEFATRRSVIVRRPVDRSSAKARR